MNLPAGAYNMKEFYNSWDDFVLDAKKNNLDVDRCFKGLYNTDGDLIGSYVMDYPGVRYKDLRTAREREIHIHDAM